MHEDEFFLNLSEFVSVIDSDGSTRVVSKYALYREYINRRNSAADSNVGSASGKENASGLRLVVGPPAKLEVPSSENGR